MRLSILVVLLLAVPAFAAKPRKVKASVPEKANSLHGTWTREIPGIRVTLKFTEKRLFATLQVAKKPEGKGLVEASAIKLDADYGVSPGGRVFGVVTGMDFSASDGVFAEWAKDADALQSALDELLFAFRTRVEADTLTVAGLKADGLKEAAGLLPLLLGKYHRTDGTKLPPIKPAKVEYQLSGSTTLPSPHYLRHFPTYFPPDTPRPTTGAIVGALIGAGSGGLIGRNPATGSQLREEAPKPREVPVATQMICQFESGLRSLPDTTKNGKPITVLLGKLFLFGMDRQPVAEPRGKLALLLSDITPRGIGESPRPGSIYCMDADELKRSATSDDRFGRSIELAIPWPEEWKDVTRVMIRACYTEPTEARFIRPLLTYPDVKFTVEKN